MTHTLVVDTWIHWIAVFFYVVASVANIFGLIFRKERFERASYFIVIIGILIHGSAIIYRWIASGHGPYMSRYEVLSSDAWIVLFVFLLFSRLYPKVRPASLVVFPSSFLLIALGLLSNPDVHKLPPTLRNVWLVLHVGFYKIALGTLIIALSFSILYIKKKKTTGPWLERLPDCADMDVYAYRFAGFGFTFWAIAMLSGSIWAYQSWGRYWGWDPIETWSLITWIFFGVYLHLRRFFGWKEERAAYFFIFCFLLALVSAFFVPFMETSIHSSYFVR